MTEKQPLNIEVTSMHYQKLLIAIDDDDPTSSKRAFNYAWGARSDTNSW